MGQYGSPFGMSAFLQEKLVYLGQKEVYEEASSTAEHMMGITVCAKQIERLCHHWGERCEASMEVDPEKEGPVYVMIDGSMILSRDRDENGLKWREMKLARVFREHDRLEETENRRCLTASSYVAHLGESRTFFDKLSPQLADVSRPVVVADGASWIWNQVRARWPDAVEILDYYHASEALHEFAREAGSVFKDEPEKTSWVNEQLSALLDDGIIQVMDQIELLECTSPRSQEAQRKLVRYYQSHWMRMYYRTYKQKGYMIGSGPVESAHRHVIQQRMKLSGQRWSVHGAQCMANLRAVYASGKWNDFTTMMRKAA